MKTMLRTFILLTIFNLGFLSSGCAQGIPNTVKKFVSDLADIRVSYEDIISKHLCKVEGSTSSRELKMFLLEQLKEHRNLLTKKKRASVYRIVSYQQLPKREQVLLVNEKELPNIFCMKQNDTVSFFVLVKNEKIASFSTINKGGKRVFIKYCN